MSVSGSQFMKPMLHCPDMALLKSPKQAMMEQLGLDDEDLQHQTSSSDSDSEGQDVLSPVITPVLSITSGQSEMMELKQMLRVTQRKLHLAQSNLAECEQNRERKLKIMTKTHQSALALKQALIHELQDIIEEKDEMIKSMSENGRIEIKSCVNQGELQRMVEQIVHLQKEHTALLEQFEHVSEELEQTLNEKKRLQEDLKIVKDLPVRLPVDMKSTKCHVTQQLKDLQQKVARLEQERLAAFSNVEIEKQLKIELVNLKSQLNALNKEIENKHQEKDELEYQISALQKERNWLLEEKKKLSEKSTMLETVNVALKANLVKKDSEIAILQSSLKEETDVVSHLKQKLTTEQEKITEAKEYLQLSEEKVRHLVKLVHERETNEKRAETECQNLMQQLQCLQQKQAQETEMNNYIGKSKDSLRKVSVDVYGVKEAVTEIRHLTLEFIRILRWSMSFAAKQICSRISSISNQHSILIKKYRHEIALRKKLHNKLVEFKGNIRVFCRVRPVIDEDGTGSPAAIVVEPETDDDGILCVFNRDSWKRFEVDKVFGPSSTQEQVFSEVKELVTSCADGYNICIFAYGQTGSGKTFTMEGVENNPGINQRALLELFDIVAHRQLDWDFSIVASVLEVYNESVRDLLSVNSAEKMDIKLGPDGVYVPGLTQVSVTTLEEINEVFALGHENRSTGATKMNIHSSRSHALLCITVIGINRTTGVQTIGKLNLIDLAGSERVAKSGSEGDRLQEAKYINRSLSALGDVIHSLKSKSSYTPYRNSKLTHLLQDSLGGDSKTLMVVQVAPVEKNVGETVCSLQFAQRVRAVELGRASKRVIVPFSGKFKQV